MITQVTPCFIECQIHALLWVRCELKLITAYFVLTLVTHPPTFDRRELGFVLDHFTGRRPAQCYSILLTV